MQVPRDMAMVIINIIIKNKKELIKLTGMGIIKVQDMQTDMREGTMVTMHIKDPMDIITDRTVTVGIIMDIMPRLQDHM